MATSLLKELTSRPKLLFLGLTVAFIYLFTYSKLSPVTFNFRQLIGNDSEPRFPQIRPYTTIGPPKKTAITDTTGPPHQLIRSRRNGSSDWSTTSLPLQRLQIFHWSIKNSAFEVDFDWSIKNSSLAHI